MSSGTFYLLACLATLAAVTHGAPNAPNWVPGLEELCREFNHYGACKNLNYEKSEWKCSNIYCLGKSIPGIRRPVFNIGLAPDGMKCAMNKICVAGLCESLAGEPMPLQSPFLPASKCFEKNIQRN